MFLSKPSIPASLARDAAASRYPARILAGDAIVRGNRQTVRFLSPVGPFEHNEPMNEHDVRSIYMTFPDESTAVSICGELLAEHLIACANVFPPVRSLYRWQGRIEDEPEVVAIAKSTAAQVDRLATRVNELHPYDTPCVVALDVVGGDSRYLQWVREETNGSRSMR